MFSPTEYLLTGQQFNKTYGKVMEEVALAHNLSRLDIDILLFLYNNPSLDTARDIAELRFFSKSNISKAVYSLIKQGYLAASPDPDDRRVLHLSLQPVAEPALLSASRRQQEFLAAMYSGISQEEQAMLRSVFAKISANLKNISL